MKVTISIYTGSCRAQLLCWLSIYLRDSVFAVRAKQGANSAEQTSDNSKYQTEETKHSSYDFFPENND